MLQDSEAKVCSNPPSSCHAPENSYLQIIKSSAITGGTQLATMAIGLVRTKVAAVLLGPSGIGLIAIYQSLLQIMTSIAGLGIQTSGVREVAKDYGQDDWKSIGETIRVLRRISWITGLLGVGLAIILSPWLSNISFGDSDASPQIAALGLAILFNNLAASQSAVIRGTRRIIDLAKINILGALLGLVLSLPIYYWFGKSGIIPTMIATSAITLAVSTYYASKIRVPNTEISWQETLQASRHLITFGVAMVVNGLLLAAVTYVTRLLISSEFGLEGVGQYSAAFGLSGLFVQLVLQAMSADFYPRLTAVSESPALMNRLLNEQIEIGLLLAFPGILTTLLLAPYALTLFYTGEFTTATDLLRWFALGCLGRIVSWPFGFSILAKGQTKLFAATETLANITHLILIFGGLKYFGLTGTAIAFAALNLLYAIGMYQLNRKTIGFSFSWQNRLNLFWMASVTCLTSISIRLMNGNHQLQIGIPILAICTIICAKQLLSATDFGETAWRYFRKLRSQDTSQP
jgi:PST family polysaccharide transporter